MNKIKLKKKMKLNKIDKIILLVIFVILGILLSFIYINKKVTPVFLSVAENETKKIAALVINNSVNNEVSKNLDTNKLLSIIKDNDGNVNSVDFNSALVNQFLTKITNNIEINLRYIESGNIEKFKASDFLDSYDIELLKKGIIYEIPSGVVFNNAILSNIGPKIPVKLNLIGNIISDFDIKTKNYGINNVLVEILVNLKVNLEVILPYSKRKTVVKTSIPVALKMIQGKVPSYYSGNSSPSLSIPIE